MAGDPVAVGVVVGQPDERAGEDVRDPLVRIGVPGGLTFQDWQLEALVDDERVAYYETRPREVILYLDRLAPGAACASTLFAA